MRKYTKACDECGREKPLSEFPMKITGHHHQGVCYPCHQARKRHPHPIGVGVVPRSVPLPSQNDEDLPLSQWQKGSR